MAVTPRGPTPYTIHLYSYDIDLMKFIKIKNISTIVSIELKICHPMYHQRRQGLYHVCSIRVREVRNESTVRSDK